MTKVHAAIEIASAGPQHPGGFVHQMIRDGWNYPIEAFQDAYDAGCRSLVLHRPTGAVNTEYPLDGKKKMSLFSRLVLQHDPECNELIRTAPMFLREFNKHYPEARIIAYFGTARGWHRVFPPTDKGRADAWRMAQAAMSGWLQCQWVDICFDEAGALIPGDAYGYVIDQTAQYIGPDRQVYVEAWPESWSTTAVYPSFRLERWQSSWGDFRQDQIGGTLWLEGNSVQWAPQWRDYEAWATHRARQGFDLAIGPEHVPLVIKALKGGG